MAKDPQNEICRRIAQLRLAVEGKRGKVLFAKKLGISASTYNYYEGNRVPSAEILVRIADIAKVDLRWLLTGREANPPIAADHPAIVRAARLLADHPQAAAPLAAFIDLLAAASLNFPAKIQAQVPLPSGSLRVALPSVVGGASARVSLTGRENWIPILGRSAAGVAHFWREGEKPAGLTTLDDLIDRNCRVEAASAAPSGEGDWSDVQLITLTRPSDNDVAEFIHAPAIKSRHADAFALRIDGESMTPDIRHGNLVVLSPSVPARDDRPAVVQLLGQIGVTCKLYRRNGETVCLQPVNDKYPSQQFDASVLVWALAVLAKVRAGRSE